MRTEANRVTANEGESVSHYIRTERIRCGSGHNQHHEQLQTARCRVHVHAVKHTSGINCYEASNIESRHSLHSVINRQLVIDRVFDLHVARLLPSVRGHQLLLNGSHRTERSDRHAVTCEKRRGRGRRTHGGGGIPLQSWCGRTLALSKKSSGRRADHGS